MGTSYCDAIATVSAAYQSARMIMSIGTMSAPINSFNSLTGSQATRKTAVPKLKQLSIKREVDRTRRSPGWDR